MGVGTLVAPNTLLFVKAGYSNGQVEVRFGDHEEILDSTSNSKKLDGSRVSGGVEFTYLGLIQ